MRSCKLGALIVLLAVSACQAPPAEAPGAPTAASRPRPGASGGPATRPLGELRVPVSGELRVPKLDLAPSVKLISDRGPGLVANNSGGLISDRAGGLPPAYRLAQMQASLVEGARVYLADAGGNRIPGLEPARTDAAGRFELPQVPPAMTFVVVAEVDTLRGKPAVFRTLVKVGKLGATTAIDAASTLVTVNVLEGLPGGDIGDYNPARFQQATEAASRSLRDDNLPDFTDLLAVKARMDELVREVAALRDLLGEVKAELAVIRESLDELKEAARRSPEPGAAPTPAAAATDAGKLVTPKPTPAPEATAGLPAKPTQPPGATPKPPPIGQPCVTAENKLVVPGTAVARLHLRRVEEGVPLDRSDKLGELPLVGGAYFGPVPGGCRVWVMYLDKNGLQLGNPIQNTFPPTPVRSPINLPPPFGPFGPIL
ncbi:MAG: hypothetical protein VKS61_10630 [Candidatus Sericytochromatia bacterium]|nr:hypothetical protein [Candidatus Sericytochromatia bacterium]